MLGFCSCHSRFKENISGQTKYSTVGLRERPDSILGLIGVKMYQFSGSIHVVVEGQCLEGFDSIALIKPSIKISFVLCHKRICQLGPEIPIFQYDPCCGCSVGDRRCLQLLFKPGVALLRFHCCIGYANTLMAAAIIEALVSMFCEEPEIAESDAMEFLGAGVEVQVSLLCLGEAVLSSLSCMEVKVVLVYLSVGGLGRFNVAWPAGNPTWSWSYFAWPAGF
jgi:hypothetical protein